MLASQATTASAPEESADSSKATVRQNSEPVAAEPMRMQRPAIAKVTAGVAPQGRDAAEHPQRDVADPDPVADRDHRVAELVQEDRGEEEQGADDREHVGLDVLVR
jgi:hypothetical protein